MIIRRMQLPFSFSKQNLRWERHTAGQVVRLGLPIATQDLLVCISFLAITAIVNALGVIPSAGVGVAEKICGFVLMVPSAYMQAMSAFVAQNMGAGRPDRAKKRWLAPSELLLAVGVVLSYFSFFHGGLLAQLFARDAAVIAAAAEYLKAYAIDCLLVSFLFCIMGYFNGCGRTTFVHDPRDRRRIFCADSSVLDHEPGAAGLFVSAWGWQRLLPLLYSFCCAQSISYGSVTGKKRCLQCRLWWNNPSLKERPDGIRAFFHFPEDRPSS